MGVSSAFGTFGALDFFSAIIKRNALNIVSATVRPAKAAVIVGEGLLLYGNVILPFVDKFPTNTELYDIMTTKLIEIKQE